MNRKAPPLFFWVLHASFWLLTPGIIFSQEKEEPETAPPITTELAQEELKILYYIRDIDFNITGRTRPFALINTVELRSGERLNGQQGLETYIRRKTQILRNQRVLEEDACRIDYTIGEADADGLVPVDLLVQVVDTWNIIALPEPKYDSNTGLSLTIKARDYNFLGTMTPLSIDFGYKLEDDNHSAFFAEFDTDIPFRLFNFTWNFNFDNEFKYTQDEPFFYKNTTGISLDLPFKETTFTFGFDQLFILNEENDDDEKAASGEEFFNENWYMSSEIYAQWKIPLGIEVGEFGDLVYTPKISEQIKYRPGGDIGEYRRGPATTFSHSLGFGQVNWHTNFRSGLNISIDNANELNNYYQTWSNSMGFTAIAHRIITDFWGISGRIKYRHYFNSPNTEAGDTLRGLRNKSLSADSMVSFNLEFPLRILRFVPSQWFNNRKVRLFDFELHLSPFLDLALFKGVDWDGAEYAYRELLSASGFELIAYPLSWRSIYLRGSLGWDLREWYRRGSMPDGEYREIYIGVGHYF